MHFRESVDQTQAFPRQTTIALSATGSHWEKTHFMNIRPSILLLALLGIGLFCACSESDEKNPIASGPAAGNTGGWSSLNSGHPTLGLNDVYFADANHGIIVGDSGLILKTSDGGAHWTEHWNRDTLIIPPFSPGGPETLVPMDLSLSAVYFTDALHGYATGVGVFKTSDGGDTWVSIGPALEAGSDILFAGGYAAQFPSPQVGVVVGVGGLHRTEDGGTAWKRDKLETDTVYHGSHLYDVRFADANTGYAGGLAGLFKTIDAGKTWKQLFTSGKDYIWGIHFLDANNGFVSGSFWIHKTTDGGATWTSVSTDYTPMSDIHFLDRNTGYAAGDDGIIMKTTDGGTSWTRTSTGTDQLLNAIHFPDASTGYAVGMNGVILKFKSK
jgi:photosystem II stability/assembly factor-like uncharacterized protein